MLATSPSSRHQRDQHVAFSEHVVPHIDGLYRAALAMTRHSADAEDLVQDTLIRAFRAIDSFDGRYPRAWLLTIMRNANVNRNRRQRPVLLRDGASAELALERISAPMPPSEDVVIDAEFEWNVEQALRALPEKHRAVVALVDLCGLDYQAAADALGVPRGTVMSRLHRARSKIRASLVDDGVLEVTTCGC